MPTAERMDFDFARYNPIAAWISAGALLEPHMPTYSGGLEVLTGDYFRECADRRIPMVGIIQCNGDGFFQQQFDADDMQIERPIFWDPKNSMPRIPYTVNIQYRGHDLKVGAELHVITGITGFKVPVLLIDTDFPENKDADERYILSKLYVNNTEQRIAQEYVLGRAAIKLMQEIGWDKAIKTYHMNEGHMWSAPLELLNQGFSESEIRQRFAFTTHTPIPAGHQEHDYDKVGKIGCDFIPHNIAQYAGSPKLNTTLLASYFSRNINAVSRKHADVCRHMDVFKGYDIDYITNGIHPMTWVGKHMLRLFNHYNPYWSLDPRCLDDIMHGVSKKDLLEAKEAGKLNLIPDINTRSDVKFRGDATTIVWARRFTPYKRPSLILEEGGLDRLHALAEKYGPIQLIFAGKAHPGDPGGKLELQKIRRISRSVNNKVRISFINGYDASIAKRLITGADIWLNNPRRPLEACGTSGMKALLNGTINLSSYDGWVPEGYERDPKAVFLVGPKKEQVVESTNTREEDAEDRAILSDSLEEIIQNMKNPDSHHEMIARSIALFSHFSTTRAIGEYASKWGTKIL